MVTLDLRETLIPFSLLQITNAFRKMKPGEEMEILADALETEAAIVKEIALVLPPTAYDLHLIEEQVGNEPALRLRLKKTPYNVQRKGVSSCQKSI